ncbi:MAG: flagellar motor protein MotB [Gammaproteobacteria bacterium]|nr:flagellar motor protein MotB [Gammaproteobacteria bacterium]
MSDSDDEEVVCPPEGLPAYMGTFADLMALLMCFFVLLLSFSEMDVQKYKQVAGSMAAAFGVQNKVRAKDIPKGTSVIAQEFSPGKPQPTLITAVNQQTIDTNRQTLDFTDKQGENDGEGEDDSAEAIDDELEESQQINNIFTITSESKEPTEETENLAMEVAMQMSDELDSGQIEIVAQGKFLVFRIREQGSFGSGLATIKRDFLPVLGKIRNILKDTTGRISIAGHTDNRPIYTKQFPSNWELSGARAATVARELLSTNELDRKRFHVIGHAETIPIRANDTRENRAYNRRVEIIIVQGEQVVGSEIGLTQEKKVPNNQ